MLTRYFKGTSVQILFSRVSVCQASERPNVGTLHIIFLLHIHTASSLLFLFTDRGTSRVFEQVSAEKVTITDCSAETHQLWHTRRDVPWLMFSCLCLLGSGVKSTHQAAVVSKIDSRLEQYTNAIEVSAVPWSQSYKRETGWDYICGCRNFRVMDESGTLIILQY